MIKNTLAVTSVSENHGASNARFLSVIDVETKEEIIRHIANHYRVAKNIIFEEVTNPAAESLLDYMIEPQRGSTYMLMQKHGYCSRVAK